MENRKMTVTQVIEATRDMLAAISVPVGLMDSVGTPIAHAMQNLNLCLEAIQNAEGEKNNAEADPE